MTERRRKREPLLKQAGWFQLAEAGSVGIEMAVAIAIGAFGGMYLERHVTHWAPWTSYIGLGVGIGAAGLAVVRTARKFSARIEAEERAAGQSHESNDDPEVR
ncbi:Putative F0F1-ATPase subunit Ca2+/Mg2+ transporter [Nannocystis exedens]|uniref:Putative F0F1-ATPase subunit Ca2+/Mg2+ transporter n=1 Tax=Nannocystis exedens TaxID=54 RepID=A0A1I1UBQ3_9BACT|nr:AtpZ/AtpI family protein [Nannocystis exedens]PCC71460.1 putative F0F1-ATPase subunit (ATPase_gene1) [Nannocystis exedens]SFD66203.1 Putative F0F1-ATPase subunit Ca2+/Mg2+ transporter [Nannocystis exedens]